MQSYSMKSTIPIPARFGLTVLTVATIAWLAGCTTRSISNSGYRGGSYYGHSMYRGELSDFDVLGVDRDQTITESDIAQALDTTARVKLRRGDSVVLIQSGAMFPDAPMVEELGRFLSVVPFTGVPTDARPSGGSANEPTRASYSKSLRLAAARGGCQGIICYWGVLESAREEVVGKALSWVPIVGSGVPDERQHLRIRLKLAILDVRTGNWSIFTPEPFDQKAISAKFDRQSSDQRQVETLKRQAYEAAAKDLLRVYGS